MPELPEVETTRRGLAGPLTGRVVSAVRVREPRLRWPVPAELAQHVLGQPLLEVARRAKYLLLRFPDGSLVIHLGMSGSLRVLPAHEPSAPHEHLDIEFGSLQLRLRDPRRFGAVLWAPQPEATHPLLARLGPEPLGPDFDGSLLYRAGRGKRCAVKQFIMNGAVVVGVGNIYASESLFRAGILPTTPAGRLSAERCERLATAIKETLSAAIAAGGSSLRDYVGSGGELGYFQLQTLVYGRGGEPCKVCGRTIERSVTGQRATYHCPHCQR